MFKLQLITSKLINLVVLGSFGTNIFAGSIEYREAGNRTSRSLQGLPAFLAGFRLGQGAYTTGLNDLPIPMTELHNTLPYLYPYPLPFWYSLMWNSPSGPAPSLHPVNQQRIIHLKSPFVPFKVEENYQEFEEINKQIINNILQQPNKLNIVESSTNIFGTIGDSNETGDGNTQERMITTLSRLLGNPFQNVYNAPTAKLKENSLVSSTINNTESNVTKMPANESNLTKPTATPAETTVVATTQDSRNSTTTQSTTIMSPTVAVVETNDTLVESNNSNETHQNYTSYYGGNSLADYVTFTTSKTHLTDQLHNNDVADFRTDPGIEAFLTVLTPPVESYDQHQFLKPTTNNDFYPMNPSRFSFLWSQPFSNNNIT